MSKLDNIVIECVNKALDGKEEKLGDYIDPTKQQLKDLILATYQDALLEPGVSVTLSFIKKVEEL